MRHKEQAPRGFKETSLVPIRIQCHEAAQVDDIPMDARLAFSAMKYGDPEALTQLAVEMTKVLLEDARLQKAAQDGIWLGPSAYGSVPSAASTLTAVVAELLETAGWKVSLFKIVREGGFERTDYGALGHSAREKVIRHRKIYLPPHVSASLKGQNVVILDDLRCTGEHERAICRLLEAETQVGLLAFGYCIAFNGNIRAEQEEVLNHTCIQTLDQLLPLFTAPKNGPKWNARLVKFILQHPPETLIQFWEKIGREHCTSLYWLAMQKDGYFDLRRFREGFGSLEEWLHPSGKGNRMSYKMRCEAEGKVVAYHLREVVKGRFLDAEDGQEMHDILQMYSRFKFGDITALRAFSEVLADAMIDELERGDGLMRMFERAGTQGEFVSLIAPGVRNVISASNQLARAVGLRVNAWLALQGLPTMVIRSLGRLSSGRANYAELSARQRASRQKTTETIISRSEFVDFPSHVIFLDDVEVTGQTSKRAQKKSLQAGGLSFHAAFAFKVDPSQALTDAGIEHRMNHYAIKGTLDAELAEVLAHPDYQPVQRMLRLLLHPQNHNTLREFLATHVSDEILQRIYLGAMANDYLWIHAKGPREQGEYAPSMELMAAVMRARGLLDARGRIVSGY